MELQLSAKEVNSATDDSVQTPLRDTYTYVFTNPTKPLRNSCIDFEVALAAGTVPLLLPFFLPCPNLLRHQNIPSELCLRVRAAEACQNPCSSSTFFIFRTITALQASAFLTHLLRLLIPKAQQCCSRVCYPSGRRRGVCGLLLVPSSSS